MADELYSSSCSRSPLSAMTWLEAAEGPEMHIRDLTERVMNLRMVNSSCKTSLETLLYRQTHKPNSKFQRVPGKMGWFKLTTLTGSSSVIDEDEVTPKAVVIRPRKRNHDDSDDDSDSYEDSDSEGEWILKYSYLKKLAKRMIMTNVGLANDLHHLEEEIDNCEKEKKFLYKRLTELQSTPKQEQIPKLIETPPTTSSTKTRRQRPPTKTTPITNDHLIYNEIIEPRDIFSTSSSNSEDEEILPKQNYNRKTTKQEGSGGGRKKRIRRLQPIVMNDDGSPVFPIKLGGLQVHSLGKVVFDRPSFHNERYIWPLGFKSTRSYPSMLEPARRCLYTCHILDGKDGPIFEMVSEESPQSPIRASSATACHHTVLKAINAARDKQATNAGSGPEFFGFSHPSILNLIQMLPDADKCTKYKPTQFQQPLSRGKGVATSGAGGATTKKQIVRQRVKLKPPRSPVSADPSLAPVNNQLTSLNEFSSSLSSDSSDSDNNLIIDTNNIIIH